MSYDAWPSPDSRRGPLPRIEDLPISDQGYDQEAVRRAFDDFYRHAAQLDASLKTLEAVEVFRRDAAELRNDLRSLRSLGVGASQPSWSAESWTSYERPRLELSPVVLRVSAEVVLLIVIGVIAGVSHLRPLAIVALMGAALLVVWLSEFLAARARTQLPASVYDTIDYAEPAPYVEAPALEGAVGWSAFEQPAEDDRVQEPEALTMVGEPLEDTEEDAGPEETEPAQEPLQESMEERSPETRRRWYRRRGKADLVEDSSAPDELPAQLPSHVRVLPSGEVEEKPWERGFDGESDESDES